MSVNKAIRDALEEYIAAGWPCTPDDDREKDAEHYIAFNPASDGGADYGDDLPCHNVQEMYIHMYLPIEENYLKHKKRIRQLLVAGGFSYPDVTVITDPDREGYRHIIFDCEYIAESEV